MNHYELLEISPRATIEEIQSAYEKKIVNCPKGEAVELQKAFEILKDSISRELYDTVLKEDESRKEESEYERYLAKQEKIALDNKDIVSRWIKLYRQDWSGFAKLPVSEKFQKIVSELLFRSFYAIFGAIVFLIFPLMKSRPPYSTQHLEMLLDPKHGQSLYLILMYFTMLAFFFSAKFIGKKYRKWKNEHRYQ